MTVPPSVFPLLASGAASQSGFRRDCLEQDLKDREKKSEDHPTTVPGGALHMTQQPCPPYRGGKEIQRG